MVLYISPLTVLNVLLFIFIIYVVYCYKLYTLLRYLLFILFIYICVLLIYTELFYFCVYIKLDLYNYCKEKNKSRNY